MKLKKLAAVSMAALMTLSLAACGGSGDDGEGAESTGVSISVFNSKMEIQDQFVEAAEEYSEATGVDVEVYYSSDTVAAHMATKYSANDPYTLSMVDAKDVYNLAEDYAADLTGEAWVEQTPYAISVGDRVVGFPVCVEARGLIYNADAIEAITGETFDPANYQTLDAFKGLLDQLVAGGMEYPTAILKDDWSMAGHYLPQVYEEQADPDAFVTSLTEGTVDLANDAKFNSLMDTFETLMEYNYAQDSPISAEREVSSQKLAEGEVAFMFGGNWDWAVLSAYDYSENMGIMPVPQNTEDGTNTKLVGGGSKYFFIDSTENTSDEQRQAAKDFLNWLVSDPEGNAFLTEDCQLVPAFSNIPADNLDPLGTSVKSYADAGNLIPNYNFLPDDHYSVLGASMQKYLAGEIDRAGFADEVVKYWKTAQAIPH
ncbi:MAG: carbohydrate ABC transporter substrate-binding protein [Clostridiales bacterium]|nr:carbohydrate ABC transporter substrate-binding protein [Clostridiales bacterium]